MMLSLQKSFKKIVGNGERSQGVFSGSVVMLLSTLISTLTRVGLISILARIYTKDQFGLWVTITSVTAIMANNDFGIGNALRNKLSQLRIASNPDSVDEAREYFLSVFYFFLFFSIVISAALLLFEHAIPYHKILKTDNGALKTEVVHILTVVQLLFVLSIPMGIGSTMFFAYQETVWVGVLNILNGLLTVLVVGYLALKESSVTAAAITFFSISLAISTAGSFYFLYRRKWNMFDVKLRQLWRRVWSLLSESIAFAILQISYTFMYNSITIVVTANVSLPEAAELNLVQKLYTFILAVYLSLYNPLWAGFSDAIHRKDWAWLKRTVNKTLLGTTLLFLLALGTFSFAGNFFLQLLAGQNYVSHTALFALMGFWALFYATYLLGIAFLSAAGKIKPIVALTGGFAIIFISVAGYFTRNWGLTGISLWSVLAFGFLTAAAYYHAFFIIKRGEQSAIHDVKLKAVLEQVY